MLRIILAALFSSLLAKPILAENISVSASKGGLIFHLESNPECVVGEYLRVDVSISNESDSDINIPIDTLNCKTHQSSNVELEFLSNSLENTIFSDLGSVPFSLRLISPSSRTRHLKFGSTVYLYRGKDVYFANELFKLHKGSEIKMRYKIIPVVSGFVDIEFDFPVRSRKVYSQNSGNQRTVIEDDSIWNGQHIRLKLEALINDQNQSTIDEYMRKVKCDISNLQDSSQIDSYLCNIPLFENHVFALWSLYMDKELSINAKNAIYSRVLESLRVGTGLKIFDSMLSHFTEPMNLSNDHKLFLKTISSIFTKHGTKFHIRYYGNFGIHPIELKTSKKLLEYLNVIQFNSDPEIRAWSQKIIQKIQ